MNHRTTRRRYIHMKRIFAKHTRQYTQQIRQILVIMLCFCQLFLLLPVQARAEEADRIAGFVPMAQEECTYVFTQEDKPSLAEVTAMLPRQLGVYLGEDSSATAMDVTWYCVGDDYDTTDDYYYQFNPRWDEDRYPLAEGLDYWEDVPYVGIHLSHEAELLSQGQSAMSQNSIGQPGQQIAPAAVTIRENEPVIYEFLLNEMGFSTAAAVGVLANLYKESGFRHDVWGDKGTSYGICQWHNSRCQALQDWCTANGYDWQTLDGQLHYLKHELSANNNKYLYNGKKIYGYLSGASNNEQGAYDAAYDWCWYYEVPAKREESSIARGNLAKDTFWSHYRGDYTLAFQKEMALATSVDAYLQASVHPWDTDCVITEGGVYFSEVGQPYPKKIVLIRAQEPEQPDPGEGGSEGPEEETQPGDNGGEETVAPGLDTPVPLVCNIASLWGSLKPNTRYCARFYVICDGKQHQGANMEFTTWESEDCPSIGYRDLTPEIWYHEYVDDVLEQGLMGSTRQDILLFAPEQVTTRATIVTILYRLSGEQETASEQTKAEWREACLTRYEDVAADSWYTEAVGWALANGVVNGTSETTFSPDDVISREQFAVMLYRYADRVQDVTERADLSVFTDAAQISDWAWEAVSWANAEGLLNGKGENLLDPQGQASRAEAAALISRFVDWIQ